MLWRSFFRFSTRLPSKAAALQKSLHADCIERQLRLRPVTLETRRLSNTQRSGCKVGTGINAPLMSHWARPRRAPAGRGSALFCGAPGHRGLARRAAPAFGSLAARSRSNGVALAASRAGGEQVAWPAGYTSSFRCYILSPFLSIRCNGSSPVAFLEPESRRSWHLAAVRLTEPSQRRLAHLIRGSSTAM